MPANRSRISHSPALPGRGRRPAASSGRHCAPRSCRARGRSASARATRVRGGSRSRAGWSLPVDVDAHHRTRASRVPCAAARRWGVLSTGLPASVMSAPDLAVAECRSPLPDTRRQLGRECSGKTADAALPASEADPRPRPAEPLGGARAGGRPGEHRAALAVEVAVIVFSTSTSQLAKCRTPGCMCRHGRRRPHAGVSEIAGRWRGSCPGDSAARRDHSGAKARANPRLPRGLRCAQ